MTAPPAEGVPARLGRYAIVERLAIGGMAEIFLARATGIQGFEKRVVVKRILPHLAADPSFVSMFLDEARLAAQLAHQNIGQVYDIGEQGGVHFFAMEYIDGRDLRHLLKDAVRRDQPVPLQQVLTVVAGAAAGLHHAHEAIDGQGRPLQIVHRDVSPSNILVTFGGSIKVVDFGIAKAAAGAAETASGTLKGKIPYMSPEQTVGKRLDRRSDLFSLGVVLYELLTSRRLFRGDSDYQVMTRIASGDVPPPSSRSERVDPALEAIVMRCLELDPDDRYQSAQELQIALEDYAAAAGMPLSTAALSRYMTEHFTGDAAGTGEGDEPSYSVDIDIEQPAPDRGPEISSPETTPVDQDTVPTVSSAAAQAVPAPSPPRRHWMAPVAVAVLLAAVGGAWLVSRPGADRDRDYETTVTPAAAGSTGAIDAAATVSFDAAVPDAATPAVDQVSAKDDDSDGTGATAGDDDRSRPDRDRPRSKRSSSKRPSTKPSKTTRDGEESWRKRGILPPD